MDLGEALMVAGIGCRAGASGEQVLAAIAAAMETLHAMQANHHRTLTAIATPTSKASEPGIRAAAESRGLPLLAIAQPDLEATNAATITRSAHSMAAMNVHSVAEAAALAGAAALARSSSNTAAVPNIIAASVDSAEPAHATPTPRLLLPRIAVGPVTCALACLTP